MESLTLLFASHDLLVYDLGAGSLRSAFTGAELLRGVEGRLRSFSITGKPIGTGFLAEPALILATPTKRELPISQILHGYDRLSDGVTVRRLIEFPSGKVDIRETIRLTREKETGRLIREWKFSNVPTSCSVDLRSLVPPDSRAELKAVIGKAARTPKERLLEATLSPDEKGVAAVEVRHELPRASSPAPVEKSVLGDPGRVEGSLERSGYRAIAYPRPKTKTGEDRVMPSALAADPKDGRVFVASMKTGEILVVRDPTDDGKQARYEDYTRGLFQEAYSMLAEPGALHVLHRRNLTKIRDTNGDGIADQFERVAGLPQGIADAYDYGYGLTRDTKGAFVYTFAPHANQHLAGSGSALRLFPGQKPREVAFGFRNPVGWTSGPEGEIFFTDNQGEWVATNKLCHLVDGRFYGYPNPSQKEHAKKPHAKTTVWVPYDWAKSINGVTHDDTGGKFGPFAGQIFMAELMFGGAIIRANVEKVNGEYQGACFPFWGQGLMGPVTLTFDPKGRLWVGGITEPGWMAQPDRGALFRIDFTGKTPFEMQSIHVQPRGFRIVFTDPVDPKTAMNPASYRIDHHRYEYSGAYGSPELDRSRLSIEKITVAADRRSVDLLTAPLVKSRVYMIQAQGVRSAKGENLVHPTGAYTLNEIPAEKR